MKKILTILVLSVMLSGCGEGVSQAEMHSKRCGSMCTRLYSGWSDIEENHRHDCIEECLPDTDFFSS